IQFPAVEVVANDTLGNHATSGGIVFTLDNVPPTGDLDPPPMTIVKYNPIVLPDFRDCDPVDCICSRGFDPVGGDAPNDLGVVNQVFDLRAEIEDDGNVGVGSDRNIIAGVQSATLYFLDDPSAPLVVDTDGDGQCDAINPNVIPIAGTPPGPM